MLWFCRLAASSLICVCPGSELVGDLLSLLNFAMNVTHTAFWQDAVSATMNREASVADWSPFYV
jgi:hypothetical protein